MKNSGSYYMGPLRLESHHVSAPHFITFITFFGKIGTRLKDFNLAESFRVLWSN